MALRLYVLLGTAQRERDSEGRAQVGAVIAYVLASSEMEALGAATMAVNEKYPRSEGWTGHDARYTRVDDACVRAAHAELEKKEETTPDAEG